MNSKIISKKRVSPSRPPKAALDLNPGLIPSQRVQKLLANAGFASRRAIEEWIKEGKIQINGKVATLGQSVSSKDFIHVNGRRVDLTKYLEEPTRVILYHKPEGEICTREAGAKNSVFCNLPPLKQGKWVSVGRLDVNTAGLLLFTNNGNLAHRLMHPSFEIERQYAVRVLGKVTDQTLDQLKEGVMLEEGICAFKSITRLEEGSGVNQWFIVSLMEGKYREVRRLWATQNCVVSRLIRIKYGTVELPRRLRKGKWQELPIEEIKKLAPNFMQAFS
jgi:23S rRNA pseudouridine2605 synthase